jgi:hypothetical protein
LIPRLFPLKHVIVQLGCCVTLIYFCLTFLMSEIIVPNESGLQHKLTEARRAIDSGSTEPQPIARGISRSEAQAFADKVERRGFQYTGDESCGNLTFFRDPAGPHEIAAEYLVLPLINWLSPWSTCESATPARVSPRVRDS